MTGAELRVVGLPPEWPAAVTTPALLSLGDPLGPLGGNVAYADCQAGPVLLYTISVFATTSVTDHVVQITARTPPANALFNCPLVTLCDVPYFTIVCMAGSQARINPPPGAICDLPVLGVEARTWTAVKNLYE
jgi:hypothetical protein